MKLLKIILLCLLLGAAIPITAQEEDGPRFTLTHDGIDRSYHLHLPPGHAQGDPLPLLVALHSVASSGEAIAGLSGFNALADEHNFAVVYPDSVGFYWDDGRVQMGLPPVGEPVDDVGFVAALLDELVRDYNIDDNRIYITGIGNGGVLAFRLACEMPYDFAGIAVVSTLMWGYLTDFCAGSDPDPVNVLLVHGSRDPVYPPDGQIFAGANRPDGVPHRRFSAAETVDFWRERNGCPQDDDPILVLGTATIFSGCDDDTEVIFYNVTGGGHSWPRVGDRTGNYALNQTGVDASELILAFMRGDTLPDQPEGTSGTPRSYTLYAPTSYDPAQPTPMIVALHGRPGNGASFAYITDLNLVAEQQGFIVVYPDGINNEWNYTGDLWGLPDYQHDDISFLSDLIDDLSLDFEIDRERVYVTGFSNGGFMTQRIACDQPDLFTAYAAVGSTLYYSVQNICQQTTPVPILLMHGTDDISIPWDGVEQTPGQPLSLSVVETLQFWVFHNECNPQSQFTEIPQAGNSPETQVVRHTFTDCADDVAVEFYLIAGGGHNWPGVPGRISEAIAGDVNMDINAGEVIWDFFRQYP